jgi:hypothetical protein
MNKIIIFSFFVVLFTSFQGSSAVALAHNTSRATDALHMNKANMHPFKEVSTEKAEKMDACVDEYPCS